MSIASEITRLSSAKAALKDAIVAKGVEVADDVKLDGYAEKVAAIPTGGGDPERAPMALFGLPDYYKILDEDKEEFPCKILFGCSCETAYDTISITNVGDKVITGDGFTYTSSATHTWTTRDPSKRYVIAYKRSGSFTNIPFSRHAITALIGNEQAFFNTAPEQMNRLKVFDCTARTNFYSFSKAIFIRGGVNDTISLRSNQFFHACERIIRIPKIISETSENAPNYYLPSLLAFPRIFDTMISADFSLLNCFSVRDSLVVFGNDGEIPDTQNAQSVGMGWLNNLKTTPNDSVVIKLNSYIKGYFTAEEQEKIALFVAGKNRTLSW